MLSPAIWAGLDFITDPFCDCCGFPFDFDTGTGLALCAACLQDRPDYTSARAALKYNDTSRDLILGFKHADHMHLALSFMPWLKAAGREYWGRTDYLVPVPLHPRRLWSRRYNQSAVLAQRLSRQVGVPALVDGLTRTRNTAAQAKLKAKERAKNVRKAFAVSPKTADLMAGKVVVLVDDVYTTGSTVNECAKALRKAGAAEVHVLTIARVVRD